MHFCSYSNGLRLTHCTWEVSLTHPSECAVMQWGDPTPFTHIHEQCALSLPAHLNILFLLAGATERPTPIGCISVTPSTLLLSTCIGAKVGIQQKKKEQILPHIPWTLTILKDTVQEKDCSMDQVLVSNLSLFKFTALLQIHCFAKSN